MSNPAGPGWRTTLVISLLGLVALEVVLRLWIISPSTPKEASAAGWVDQPLSRVVWSREGYSRSTINSFGFHDREPQESYRWRVLVCGDSYGEALHVSTPESFSSVAEQELPGLDLINTSRSGLTPFHYALYLEKHVANWEPEVVVAMINDGDLDDLLAFGFDPDPQKALEQFAAHDAVALQGWTGWKGAVERTMRQSALITFLYHRSRLLLGKEKARLQSKFSPEAASPPPDGSSFPEHLSGLYAALYERMRETGKEVLYIYVPHIDYSSQEATVSWPYRRAFYLEFARNTGAPLIDLTEPFIQAYEETGQPVHGFSNSVIGTGHINALGHEIAGRELARALETMLP